MTATPAVSVGPSGAADTGDDGVLRWVASAFAVAVLLHGLDHGRRGGDSLSADVFWAGSAAILLEVGIVLVVFARHRLAPLASVATGAGLAVGYVVVHLLPDRRLLSDALFAGGEVSRLSQAAALMEICASLALGAAGLVVLRRRGGLAGAGRPAPVPARLWADAGREPIVLLAAVGNLAIFLWTVSSL